ncbi:hypothetical protein N9N67_00395 [Bacteriovoracaceae bacterium]|nr:hypothetical protein [Bacteriovoracaceae bacterium]
MSEEHKRSELKDFKLVSYRLVPCREIKQAIDCGYPELRLIFQPIVPDPRSGMVKTRDEAIHLFYGLTKKRFKKLVYRFKNLRLTQNVNSLDEKEKLLLDPFYLFELKKDRFKFNLEYGKKLNAIIQKGTSWGKIYKLTFFKTLEENFLNQKTFQNEQKLTWMFGGFDIDKGNFENFDLIGGGIEKEFGKSKIKIQVAKSLNGAITETNGLEDIYRIMQDSRNLAVELRRNPLRVYKELLPLEDSNIHHSGTTSCLSCHMASGTILSAEKKLLDRGQDYDYLPSFQGSKKLFTDFNNIEKEITTFHMFSYLFLKPVISQRVINDTILSREYFINNY